MEIVISLVSQSILSGFLIGIGNISMMICENRMVGSLLFSSALLVIIHNSLPLYTGRIGKVIERKNFFQCFFILVCNILGCVLASVMFLMMSSGNWGILIGTAEVKFQYGFLRMFVAGFMCNVLIHVAITTKQDIVTILCIMVFILSGYSHSIADSGFAFAYLRVEYLLKWLFILAGNTAGGIVTEILLNSGKLILKDKEKKHE